MDFNSMKDQLKEKGKTEFADKAESVKQDLTNKFNDKFGSGEKKADASQKQDTEAITGNDAEPNLNEDEKKSAASVPLQPRKTANLEADEPETGAADDVDAEDEEEVA